MSTGHYENFPVASILCPPALRPAVLAIYRFARVADDLADEGDAAPAVRLESLAHYREELVRAHRGDPARKWPQVFDPLRIEIARHTLPLGLLADLLDAFEQDCTNPAYPRRTDLLDYCRRSANPVGRLLLHLYRVDDPVALQQSDAICTALQLTNFWQDASVDLPRGRVYFPIEDLSRRGLAVADLAGADTTATEALIADLVSWTRGLMHSGSALDSRIPGRAGWELRLVVQGGLRILDKIERLRYRTLATRPVLGRADLLPMLWHALHTPGRSGATVKAAA